MSDVKRFAWVGIHGLAQQENGKWVNYEDYAALQRKLDAATKRADACMNAERVWEKAMMEAIGEDGPSCVSKAIAALKAERDAVVAESKARGEVVGRLIGQYSAAGYHAVQNSLNPGQSLLHDAMQVMKSTNTDAILNGVRADAVNHAGKMIMAIMNHQDKGVERALECLAQVEMGYILAAQLRTAAPKGDSDEVKP